jgi:radical SAM protein with 4Fe4S-binding SPASM domain
MAARGVHSHAAGIRDGNGILFISHVGDVCPSGFMEVPAGNVREEDVLEIYRTAPLFRLLRDVDAFAGRCGACEYRAACGGSRARAYAATGNPLSEDPLCVYTPRALTRPA